MKTPHVTLLAIIIGLAFWALNIAFADFLGQTINLVQKFFLYPGLVAAGMFFFEYFRLKHHGADPAVSWPNWAAFAFILIPVIAGSGALASTFFLPAESTNTMLFSLAATTGLQMANLANEI